MVKKGIDSKHGGDSDVIARNRKAFHDYEILESFEAGIELCGTEVKSCRNHGAQLHDAYASVETGELFVYGLHISPYEMGNRFNHEPVRRRKLLMHKKEILKLFSRVREKGFALIPLKLYFKRGRVKVELGVARGKTFGDKRETLRKKQDALDMRRISKETR